jgi:hypothetical protein
MRNLAATLVVALGGFAVMVLEIVGARFLARDFGGSFYVWVSQIGVILGALALGYYCGGAAADRFQRLSFLAWALLPTGAFIFGIPSFSKGMLDAIIQRHPVNAPIPPIWQKLDPALGSALVFFLPCFVLAMLSPYMVRVAARQIAHVGRTSGLIYAASTVGSIAGVFVSGYFLIEHMTVSNIFRATGGLTVLLGLICLALDRWFRAQKESEDA